MWRHAPAHPQVAYGQDRVRNGRHLKYTEQTVRTADRESSFIIRFGYEIINPCAHNTELVYFEVTQRHKPEGDTENERIQIRDVTICEQEGSEGKHKTRNFRVFILCLYC